MAMMRSLLSCLRASYSNLLQIQIDLDAFLAIERKQIAMKSAICRRAPLT